MYLFSPEAHFFESEPIPPMIEGGRPSDKEVMILIKECNRCARHLPINYELENPTAERYHLAFTNHCTAVTRIPCEHPGFGLLKSRNGEPEINLTHGFQLECRFCKKFEVNAAHNPQRTAAQMKEDGARRRHIELLHEHIYKGTPQLVYKEIHGTELVDDIWEKFNRECFGCKEPLNSPRNMHLDHTRPLMMLWPLDETATCLCGECNNQKSGTPPAIFYSKAKLAKLSNITGLTLAELACQGPNEKIIDYIENHLDWFFDTFLTVPDMMRVHDGKVAGELLVRALKKPFSASKKRRINIVTEYNRRRRSL